MIVVTYITRLDLSVSGPLLMLYLILKVIGLSIEGWDVHGDGMGREMHSPFSSPTIYYVPYFRHVPT